MPRSARMYISQHVGSYHITSRIVGREFLIDEAGKEKYLSLLETMASAFFIKLHAFVIMDNHIHLFLTGMEEEAQKASKEELLERYAIIYPSKAGPPTGSLDVDGREIPDDDYGIKRLRDRLGDVSRFMQELQQSFSRWYNKRNNRVGCLWESRFKSVLFAKGESQLVCASYVDLNPIRAGIVRKPEDYRWSSIGLQARNPERFEKFITPIEILKEKGESCWNWYRVFLYFAGAVEKKNCASIESSLVNEVKKLHGQLKLRDKLSYRIRNLSEGVGIGTKDFIESLQRKLKHKLVKARESLAPPFFTTRSFKT